MGKPQEEKEEEYLANAPARTQEILEYPRDCSKPNQMEHHPQQLD
jgi:hypothetical protein